MNIKLPEPIENYLRFRSGEKPEESAHLFATEATIFDNGEDYKVSGREAIKHWHTEVAAKYKMTLEVISFTEEDGEIVVSILVSGNFPGNPAEFVYRFTLSSGHIEKLVIDFVGFR